MKEKIYLDTLPEGYCLHWYELKSVLGRGGYGITYLALDKNLDRMVAIKEYLPTDFAARKSDDTVKPITGEKGEIFNWGLDRFLKEARTLAKFTHPNIVRVLSVFEQNNTAYMIMEYEHGSSLAKLYKNSPPYTEQQLLDVFVPILDGLALVHDSGFIHRDIKPANIYIRENNTPVLLDFGSARRTSGSLTHALTSLVTFGYAPFEQYNESGGKQGPWTDIYSLGATMYLGIEGKLPIDAMTRGGSYINNEADPYVPISEKAAGKYSHEFLLAIDNALLFRTEDRPQDTLSWTDMLLGKTPAIPLPSRLLTPIAEENEEDQTIIMPRGQRSQPTTGGHSERYSGTPAGDDEGLVSSSNAYQGPISQRTTPPSYRTTPPDENTPFYQNALDKDKLVVINNTISAFLKHQYLPWAITGIAVFLVALVIIWAALPDSDENTVTSEQNTVVTSEPEKTQAPEPVQVKSSSDKSLEISRLLKQANEDFAEGRIVQPQGQSAVYHYLRVLDVDPYNELAKKGIDRVLTFYSNAAKSFLNAGDIREAEKNIKIMEAISQKSSITQQVRSQFEASTQHLAQIGPLLDKAQGLLRKKKYSKPAGNNAYELYKNVLEIDPENQQAKDGITKIVKYYESNTKKYINAHNAQMANISLARLKEIAPASKNIPVWSASINDLKKDDTMIQPWLTKAQISFANDKVSKPDNDSALYWYRRVLAKQPRNKKALAGIDNIVAFYYKQFNKLIAANNLTSAEKVMETVYNIAPKSKSYKKMKTQLSKLPTDNHVKTPEIEAISELIGKYKYALEAHDKKKIMRLSAVSPSREDFMTQLFSQYEKFKVDISGVKFIGRENRATARVSIVNLVNKSGNPVKPGQWSKFDIVIRKNSRNHWTIFW